MLGKIRIAVPVALVDIQTKQETIVIKSKTNIFRSLVVNTRL
jgi:hypothetical protein